MVSLVIEEGLSLVKVSTYRVIVFFNLKVKQKVKAVNHEKDYHDKFSSKVVKYLNKPQNYNFCTKVEVEIIDHGVKKTVLKEVENTECIWTNVTFKTWHNVWSSLFPQFHS